MKKLSDPQAYFALLRTDLYVFLHQAFATVHPGKDLIANWHIEAIVHQLELSMQGHRPRLIINLPPRHLKSFIVSVALPAFILGLDPSAKIICVSYSDDLAKALARDCKRIVESDWYRAVFPNVRLSKVTENEVVTEDGGFRYATSVGGTLTGRGADFIIIDDPTKPEEAASDKARTWVNGWFRSTVLSRLDDKARSVLIIVMQRQHVNDLAGFAEASDGYYKVAVPAIATRDEVINLRNGEVYRRREGEPLQQDRESIEVLHRMRDEIGAFNFSSQYQQAPETPNGGMIKRKWLQRIERVPAGYGRGEFFVSIDSAWSTSSTADFSAISVVFASRGKFYVIRAERGRWDYEILKAKALNYIEMLGSPSRPVTFVIERAGSGISLLKYLRELRPDKHRVFDCLPKNDKVVRAAYALPIFESGRVYIVDGGGKNAWVEPYINEFVSFPNGRYDDQVDSLVQLLPWADRRLNSGGGFYIVG